MFKTFIEKITKDYNKVVDKPRKILLPFMENLQILWMLSSNHLIFREILTKNKNGKSNFIS
jgi:hypothetical protein